MNSLPSNRKSVLANTDQSVSFAELFFDLVFVFSVTQVVHLLDAGFDWTHISMAILVFWLVWWAWTQFTWALNAADTTHSGIQLFTLLATAIAFMAISVPEAFSSKAEWFAISYVAVRSIGLLIYLWVSWEDAAMRTAVKTFGVVSVAGLIAVLAGGYFGGNIQFGCWGIAILLDIIAAGISGRNSNWNLHPKHFAERHGLFIIIVLGETMIIAATEVAHETWTPYLLLVSVLAVGITGCFWWMYFLKQNKLEHLLSIKTGADQSTMARDAYSLLHFPMLCGLIIYGYAIHQCMAHPDEVLAVMGRLALSIGILLFSAGLILVMWRASGKFYLANLLITLLTAVILFEISNVVVSVTLALAITGLLILCFKENSQRE